MSDDSKYWSDEVISSKSDELSQKAHFVNVGKKLLSSNFERGTLFLITRIVIKFLEKIWFKIKNNIAL
jgi:hypothetical protein